MANGIFTPWLAERTTRLSNGCLLWNGSKDRNGYGKTRYQGTHGLVHRIVYQQTQGVVPEGMEIGHLCEFSSCVEPTHLKAMTRKENMSTARNVHRNKTHCPKGHPYAGQRPVPSGKRVCRICVAERHYRDMEDPVKRARHNELKRSRRKAGVLNG